MFVSIYFISVFAYMYISLCEFEYIVDVFKCKDIKGVCVIMQCSMPPTPYPLLTARFNYSLDALEFLQE